ncbi:MAG: leucine-rich repeat domain-containing protein [Rickettsiales bacterium]|jgi:hypothetical protein|nr:leucine-rich repeat domain-containing protein [Rickettsiales bacterium]
MSFGQYLKGDTLVLPCTVNIGKLVSFLRSNTNITKLSLKGSGHEKMLTVFGGVRYIHLKLKNLTELNLPFNEITNEGVKELAKLPNLISLDLSGNKIGNKGAEELAELPNLISLDLSSNWLNHEGIKKLAKFPNLTLLSLSLYHVSDEGIKELAKFPKLTSFFLWSRSINRFINDSINDKDIEKLAKLPNLTSFSLQDYNISDESIKKLAKLPNLTSLSLQNRNINDKCVKELVRFPKLTSLSLAGNNIGGGSIKELAKLPNLTSLDLSYTNITDEDIKELQNKLPKCRIEFRAIIKPNTEIKPNTDMKYYVGISTAIGLLLGLSTAYLAGAAALTPVGAAIAVFFAAAAVGALIGYGIGRFCQRVSEEKQEDPDLSTWDAVKSVISDAWTAECPIFAGLTQVITRRKTAMSAYFKKLLGVPVKFYKF